MKNETYTLRNCFGVTMDMNFQNLSFDIEATEQSVNGGVSIDLERDLCMGPMCNAGIMIGSKSQRSIFEET